MTSDVRELLTFSWSSTPAADAVARQRERVRNLPDQAPAWLRLDEVRLSAEDAARVPTRPTLVLGMGGSALGARCALAFAAAEGLEPGPVRVLDTVDPVVVRDELAWAQAHDASLIAVSKSGKTVEVLGLVEAAVARNLKTPFLVTDPGTTPLRTRLEGLGCPGVAEIPADLGGRYSVFSAVGQLPLQAAGLPHDGVWKGAKAFQDDLGGAMGELLAQSLAWRSAHPAATSILWCYSDALLTWAAWLQQLECESLGRTKEDGVKVGELLTGLRGPADQHSVAQLLLDGPTDKRISVVDFVGAPENLEPQLQPLARLQAAERDATFDAMTLPARRVLLRSRSLADLGAFMAMGMAETVLAAEELGVSPYGQPAVEQIKRRIRSNLGEA